jgi:hydrogenase nickel incorporation protein HypA/HybF
MHELGIAAAILERVEAEAQRHPDVRLTRVGVRVGEISGVDPDALSFGFECLVKDTALDQLSLAIEHCPRVQMCPRCSHEFPAPESMTSCPKCGDTHTTCVGGEELDIAYIEMEEPETAASSPVSS